MRWLLTSVALLLASRSLAQAPDEHRGRLSERVTCSIAAGVKFGVPVNIVLAIAQIEGGRPGQWVRNRNGTHDVGPMQFNTRYLKHLRGYGITPADVAATGCYPYELAAWRLRKHLERDRGDRWTRIANYHSRSPYENAKYRAKVMRAAGAWARWLSEHFEDRARDGVVFRLRANRPPSVHTNAAMPETARAAPLAKIGQPKRLHSGTAVRSVPMSADQREERALMMALKEH